MSGYVGAAHAFHDAEFVRDWANRFVPTAPRIQLFDLILDQVTGRDSLTTDYVLSELATCPECGGTVVEDTLVEPVGMEKAGRIDPSFLD